MSTEHTSNATHVHPSKGRQVQRQRHCLHRIVQHERDHADLAIAAGGPRERVQGVPSIKEHGGDEDDDRLVHGAHNPPRDRLPVEELPRPPDVVERRIRQRDPDGNHAAGVRSAAGKRCPPHRFKQ